MMTYGHAHFSQHPGGDLAGVGAAVLEMAILGGNLDVGVGSGFEGGSDRGERHADGNLGSGIGDKRLEGSRSA